MVPDVITEKKKKKKDKVNRIFLLFLQIYYSFLLNI